MEVEYINNDHSKIILALLLPLFAAISSRIIKNRNLREIFTLSFAVLLFATIWNIYQGYLLGEKIELNLVEFVDGVKISFNPDALGILFALIASFLWGVTTIYAIGYMRGNDEKNQDKFYSYFAIAIFAAIGAALSGNLLTLFLFYEILTISTYPLVTHSGTEEAKKSGRKYLGILLGTSIGLQLPAIIWVYYLSDGNLDFDSKENPILDGLVSAPVAGLMMFLFVYGIGKAAVMPFHKWLPAAMVAPTPVSALLHAVAVVKAGLFTMLKVIVYVFGIENLQEMLAISPNSLGWVSWAAAFTVVTASIIALRQDNLKLRLAYSTVSQLSYVVMACGMYNYKAIMGGSIHIASHAFAKITLFFAAGAIYTASKKKYISQLNGLAKRMPISCACFAIGAISMIGLPPTAGLISKFYLMLGAHERSEYFVTELIISTVLNASYFLPIIFAMYFKTEDHPAEGKYKNHKEAPLPILIAISITAIFTVLIFIHPDPIINLANDFANEPHGEVISDITNKYGK
jgi:multicomponent Na+:H+ antiporter subunit D